MNVLVCESVDVTRDMRARKDSVAVFAVKFVVRIFEKKIARKMLVRGSLPAYSQNMHSYISVWWPPFCCKSSEHRFKILQVKSDHIVTSVVLMRGRIADERPQTVARGAEVDTQLFLQGKKN